LEKHERGMMRLEAVVEEGVIDYFVGAGL